MKSLEATLCFNSNARQGGDEKLAQIESILKEKGVSYNSLDPLSLKSVSAKRLGPILIAVGGDGTVNLVAAAALKHKRKLGVIPLGTFNHFAKDAGVALDFKKATQRVFSGKVKRVDVVRVNGQVILNNSAIGFYPHLVAKREKLQGKIGKWLALVIVTPTVVARARRYRLQLELDSRTVNVRTSLLVVANNNYDVKNFGLAERHAINAGRLYVYVVKPHSLWGVMGVSLRLLVGKVSGDDFDRYDARKVRITNPKTKLRVAIDGESLRFKTPLNYEMMPKSLTVII